MAKAFDETIRDKQADSTIRQRTRHTLESESFGEKLAQRILEANNVINLFATHAERLV